MITTEEMTDYPEVKEIVEKYGNERKNLLPILKEIQEKKNFISTEAQQIVADLLGIHPVEVFSVISFYQFLHNQPKGKYIIRLCKSISCELNGKKDVKEEIEKKLGIKAGETTPDGMFSFEEVNCLGLCDVGPAVTVNEQVFTHVTKEKVDEIFQDILAREK